MASGNIQLLMIGASLLLISLIVHLIRKQRLYEKYAIIWLAVAFGMLFFSVFRMEVNRVAQWFGVYYPPSLILVFVLLGLVIVGLHFSVVLTRFKRDHVRLVQELALLKERINQNGKVSVDEDRIGEA